MCQKGFIEYHLLRYPKMTTTDIIKLVYQAILGPNHLLSKTSLTKVKNYIQSEVNEQSISCDNLYEWISPKYVRVNIKKYYEMYGNIDKLALDFYNSNTEEKINKEYLKEVLKKYIDSNELTDYDFNPVSHSKIYKEIYHPHYRLINSKYVDLDMKIKQLDNYISNLPKQTVIALDGKCGSGKTTISNILESKYSVIHIDDFFLSKKQKESCKVKLNSNLDYDLIMSNLEKVILAMKNNVSKIKIICFNCTSQSYYEKELILKDKLIVEGVYASSPKIAKYIDKIAYLYVDKKTQEERIKTRKLSNRFFHEWIPQENKYFTDFDIFRHCDVII